MDKIAKHGAVKQYVSDRLDRMKWTDGKTLVHYYYDPKGIRDFTPVCAIKEGYSTIRNKPMYCVFWNGWGIAESMDLDALKRDVEQKYRIDCMKPFKQDVV